EEGIVRFEPRSTSRTAALAPPATTIVRPSAGAALRLGKTLAGAPCFTRAAWSSRTAQADGAAEATGSCGSTTIEVPGAAPASSDVTTAPATAPLCFKNVLRFIFVSYDAFGVCLPREMCVQLDQPRSIGAGQLPESGVRNLRN